MCLKRKGEATSIFLDDFPSYRYFAPVYYYLGRAQEGLKSPAAKESYQKFLRSRKRTRAILLSKTPANVMLIFDL